MTSHLWRFEAILYLLRLTRKIGSSPPIHRTLTHTLQSTQPLPYISIFSHVSILRCVPHSSPLSSPNSTDLLFLSSNFPPFSHPISHVSSHPPTPPTSPLSPNYKMSDLSIPQRLRRWQSQGLHSEIQSFLGTYLISLHGRGDIDTWKAYVQ